MSSWYEQAEAKLEKGSKTVKGKKESAMADAVKAVLLDFSRQEEEFAQAVVQGGSFQECMSAIADGVGSSISDLDAYKRAVGFYFPGADISVVMRIDLCASVREDSDSAGGILLNFDDFL